MARRRATIMSVAAALVASATAALVAAPPAAAGATRPPALPGTVHFSSPTALRTCTGATPTSVSISMAYDATRLTGPLNLSVSADFSSTDGSVQVSGTPVSLVVAPGTTGTVAQEIQVPTGAAALDDAWIAVQDASSGWDFGSLAFPLQCSGAAPLADPAPALTANMVCGGHTTLTFDGIGSALSWNSFLVLRLGGFGPGPSIPAGTVVTYDMGPTADLVGGFAVQLSVTSANSENVALDNIFTPPACDTTAPRVALTAPTAPFTLASSARVAWSGSDAGSGVASYQVRFRKAAWNGGFGGFSYPAQWAALTGTALTAGGLSRGYSYCFSVRGRDHAGNVSGWTIERCVAVPLDDRSIASDRGWGRGNGTAFWNHTVTVTRTLGARMVRTGARLDRLALVATRCPTCGTVAVYAGSRLIAKVNLYTPATHFRSLIVLPRFSYRAVTVVVKVLSGGRTVQIDGLGISRA